MAKGQCKWASKNAKQMRTQNEIVFHICLRHP